jgi:hypothetical protein
VNTKYTEQEPSLFNSPASSAVLESPLPFESTEDPISSFSIEIQEYAIIEDLLFVLMVIFFIN